MTSKHCGPLTLGEWLREAVHALGERLLGREHHELALAMAQPAPRPPRPAALRAVSIREWREPQCPRVAVASRERRSGSDRRRRDLGAPYGIERRSGQDARQRAGGR
jgi:hypothetical protein